MQQAEAATVGVSKHHNVITLRSSDIQAIQYVQGSFAISDGQPYDLPPVIKGAGGVWTVDINCGRHKTKPVAEGFTALSGGKDYVYNPYSQGDRTPSELNFYLALKVTLAAAGQAVDVNLYVAQGSNLLGNNWWIGGTGLGNRGSGPVVIPIVGYDSGLNAVVTRQVYEVVFAADNEIKLQTWM